MNKRLLFLLLAVVLAILSTVCAPVQAAEQIYHYDSIHVHINVQSNSDMDIAETQKLVYESGTFHYAYRWFPLDRVNAIDKVSVSEGDRLYPIDPAVRGWIEERQKKGTTPGGNSYAYATWIDDNKLWIGWWFPATRNMSRTWTIRYRVRGGLRISQANDELYWKAVFGDRTVRVNIAHVNVNLPEILPAGQVKIASYGTAARSRLVDNPAEFTALNIPAKVELEIQVRFPHGIVTASPPPWQPKLERQEAYNNNIKPWINIFLMIIGLIVIPVIGFVWLRRMQASRGAKPRVPVPDIVYSAPDDLPPAFVGLLAGIGYPGLGIIGTIFDLARRGIIQIGEIETTSRKRKDIVITRVNHDEKYEFEKLVTRILSDPGGKKLSKQVRVLPSMAKRFQKEVEREAVRYGLFREEPSHSQGVPLPVTVLVVSSFVLAFGLSTLFSQYAELIFIPFVVMFIVGWVAAVMSSRMIPFTEMGAEKAARWRAFRKYLEGAARDVTIAKDSLNIWDSYLPYAVVFGLTANWIKRFTELDARVPTWYSDTSTSTSVLSTASSDISLSSIGSAFTSMANTISSTFSGAASGGGGGGGSG